MIRPWAMKFKLGKTSDISEGSTSRFDVNGIPIMVARVADGFFATSAICTHEEADLSLGMIFESVVMCPLHQAKFEVRTGQVLEGPNGTEAGTIRNLKTYPVSVENDEIWIEV